ncbi:uncharacterized protein VTP21DRAFT_11487 [Calcarisporiella thermophila]|uniref:uncharacterized protein n=1 Tax=Calcarisporiella thermophila TaxID=911321 RepID=UPI00374347C4
MRFSILLFICCIALIHEVAAQRKGAQKALAQQPAQKPIKQTANKVRISLFNDITMQKAVATVTSDQEGCANVQQPVTVKAAEIVGNYKLVLYSKPNCQKGEHWFFPGAGAYSSSRGINMMSLQLCGENRQNCGGFS